MKESAYAVEILEAEAEACPPVFLSRSSRKACALVDLAAWMVDRTACCAALTVPNPLASPRDAILPVCSSILGLRLGVSGCLEYTPQARYWNGSCPPRTSWRARHKFAKWESLQGFPELSTCSLEHVCHPHCAWQRLALRSRLEILTASCCIVKRFALWFSVKTVVILAALGLQLGRVDNWDDAVQRVASLLPSTTEFGLA